MPRIEKTIEIHLTHEELCEAVREWIGSHCLSVDVCIGGGGVEFLTDELKPFSYEITARATERS